MRALIRVALDRALRRRRICEACGAPRGDRRDAFCSDACAETYVYYEA